MDDPSDPGGRTAYGITQHTYDAYRASKSLDSADVFNISKSEVASIYRQNYWDAGDCDHLDWPLCLVHFDSRVQHGPKVARAFLMSANGHGSTPYDKATYILDLRTEYYKNIAAHNNKLLKFLKGWLNRIATLRADIAPVRQLLTP